MSQPTSYALTQSALYMKKKKQIDSLFVYSSDACEISPGEYHISLHSGSQEFILKIQLPTDFPSQQPLIWINPPIQHNWVTDNGRVLSPGLVNYSEQSDLGHIVHEIVREMKKLPDIIIMNSTSHNGARMSEESSCTSQSTHCQQYFPIPPFIPELESLARNQIKNLNENKDILDQFVDELPQAEALSSEVDNLLQSVEKRSKAISDVKETLNLKQQKLLEHYTIMNQVKQDWDLLNAQHQNLSQRYLPNNIETSLQKAAALAEETSEAIAEVFLSGTMDAETFLTSYTASRTTSHLRKTKEEILHKQLQELQRLGY